MSNAKFVADINTEYGINASTEELQALATARANGDLSQHEYLAELKRRGVLRNDFSQENNADRYANTYRLRKLLFSEPMIKGAKK